MAAAVPEAFESCGKAGVPVWVYTVNEPEEMRRLMDLGAAALFTDFPDRLKEVLTRPS